MVQVKSGSPHGLAFVQVALMGPDGRHYGTSGYGAAAGVNSHAYLCRNPTAADLPLPDRTTIDFQGGDKWLGSFQYGITSLGSFNITLDNIDATLIAMVTGSLVDQTTNQKWTIYSENILASSLPQVCILVTFRLQSRESGTDGGSYYITYMINRAWMAPKGVTGAPSFQARGQYTFQITPTASDKMVTGLAFGANQNYDNNRTPIVAIISDNPLGLSMFIGDGADTTFESGYRGLTTNVDSDNGTNHMVKNGTITDLSTYVTTTKVATLTGAGTTLDYHSLLYETGFVA